MVLPRKEELLALAIESLRSADLYVERLTAPTVHPADLQVWVGDVPTVLRIYVWNVSHGGGRARSANEYRIQVTGVNGFVAPHDGAVLILGWFAQLEVFAAFDFMYHTGVLGNSPSIQIGRNALEAAVENGLSPYSRGNGELAIAVRRDMLALYVQHRRDLHAFGASEAMLDALVDVTNNPENVPARKLTQLSVERRTVLVTTARLLRDVKFRDRVMIAYGHSCAFCGVQFDLLDAAHILPVNHRASTDAVTNGIALCALHHRAYDRCLITFDTKYRIVVDEARIDGFRERERASGENDFRRALKRTLVLPSDEADWPDYVMTETANKLRGWKGL